MTEFKTPRDIYIEKGLLNSPVNPPRDFSIGRILIRFRWSSDRWSLVTQDGHLHDDFFRISRVQNISGTKFLNIILWRISLSIGIMHGKCKNNSG